MIKQFFDGLTIVISPFRYQKFFFKTGNLWSLENASATGPCG
jgi:hypothetical protein